MTDWRRFALLVPATEVATAVGRFSAAFGDTGEAAAGNFGVELRDGSGGAWSGCCGLASDAQLATLTAGLGAGTRLAWWDDGGGAVLGTLGLGALVGQSGSWGACLAAIGLTRFDDGNF